MMLYLLMGLAALISVLLLFGCNSSRGKEVKSQVAHTKNNEMTEGKSIITLGGGCFWCTEAVFQRLEGVDTVISGYMGGHTTDPTYKDICTGLTGHAEVVRIFFDPGKISLYDLLEVFFTTHDPTTLKRQGADVGTQYRSVIFYENEEQKAISTKVIKELNEEKVFSAPIVTEVSPTSTFYPAEDYHQNYYNLNTAQPYCSFVISPKIQKLEKVFREKLKD